MEIAFKDKKLGEMVVDQKRLVRALGPRRAELLLLRLSQMVSARNTEVLKTSRGHYHALTGDRKGQWACNLDQPYRLIFIVEENTIIIQEIIDYHGV